MPQDDPSATPGLLEYRRLAKLSRERLKELSGVGVTTILRMERGMTKNPASGTLQRLAAALHAHLAVPEAAILGDLQAKHLDYQPPQHSLRHYRQQANMTLEELAEAVGVSVGAISTFERQLIDTMFLSTALRIARVLAERLPQESASDILFNIAVAAEGQ